MKSHAKKSTTTSLTATRSASRPFFAKAGGGSFFAPSSVQAAPAVQLKMSVNKPGDKFEQEADKMATKVMRMTTPASPGKKEGLQRQEEEKLQKQEEDKLQKAPAEEDRLQRKGSVASAIAADTQSAIRNKTTGGQSLSTDVRSYMEPRFSADFSKVRIHADEESASLSNQLSARAFTYQNHIFFSRDQYQPGTSEGKQLLAHELTHTIQQGHAVQRSQQVTTTATPPPIQRLGIQDALDYFAERASHIPGFRRLTTIMGFNPINRQPTDRSPASILRALIEFIPGGHSITQALDNHGVFTRAGEWVEQQLATLGDIGSDIVASLRRFLDRLSWRDIFDLGGVWERAQSIFTNPVRRLIYFAGRVAYGIMQLVKEAILRPLARMAEGTRGYDLLKAVLGRDPITGDPVPRNAETLIGGFMRLIGQEEVWQNIQRGNAVARAWAWFQGALSGLMGFVRAIPQRIVQALASITWQDVVTIVGVFAKVGGTFLNISGQFISWAGRQVISLLEIIFMVVAPGAIPYIKKAKGAFRSIIQNPIGFLGNLVSAGKLGFQMFASNIAEHLKTALIKWIVGPLADAGVYIPKSFSLLEIVKLVLSVLGLTWQAIRTKLVKIIPEPVLVGLEKTVGILVTLVKDGPAAAWEQIKAELSELKDSLIVQMVEMVAREVAKAALVKLVSMLNLAGAVIQAIIAIYNTITFFIQKINQIAAVVGAFINSIAAIAAGQVTNAAKKVEQTMANTLTVVIAFLAKFAGLGNIPEKVVGIIRKIRKPIDKGLDKIVGWLGNMLKKMMGKKDEEGDFREKAKAELASKFKGKLNPGQIKGIVKGVYAKYKADGLKGVIAKAIPGKTGQYEGILIASRIKVATAEASFEIDTSDLDLGWGRTAATGVLTAGPKTKTFGPCRNDGTNHAEEKLIKQMDDNWEEVAAPKASGITNNLTLSITRSPCGNMPKAHKCAQQIQQFAARWQRKYNLNLTVRAASIYHGKFRKASREAIKKLADSGIKFTTWNLIAELGDPSEVDKVTLDKLQKRIDSTRENLPEIIEVGAGE